jgi:dihydrofolate synthase/folylpolyglutamate synthase
MMATGYGPEYDAALAFLLAPTDPSRPTVASPTADQNLPRMRRLLDLLGAPDARFPTVVVAGTKGKGSTSATLAALLRAAGLRVGLYSQPHLHDYRERVRVDGLPIAPDALVASVARLRPAVAQVTDEGILGAPSTYDLGTALALDHFGAAGVDIAVLEVGLGGRYDSVNTVVPRVSIITAISRDHMAVLGDTIAKIAWEKAGIIKPGVPVIAERQPEADAAAVLREVAATVGAPLHWADELVAVTAAPDQPDPLTGTQRLTIALGQSAVGGRQSAGDEGAVGEGQPLAAGAGAATAPSADRRLPTADSFPAILPLLGHFQRPNVAAALAAATVLTGQGLLTLDEATIVRGLAATRWPGRLEIVRRDPLTIVDGAHNDASARQLRQALAELFPSRPLTLVLGTSLDKDIAGIAAALVPAAARLILTVSAHPRSAPLALLRERCAPYGRAAAETATVADGLARAVALTPPDGLICATGSLFVVADAREAVGLGGAVAV